MIPQIKVSSNAADVAFVFKQASKKGSFKKGLARTTFLKIGLHLERRIKEQVSGKRLKVRTGNLRRSVYFRIVGSKDSIEVHAGIDPKKAPYAAIQEEGGTIRPKRAKFLTIPVGRNLTKISRVMRVSPREFISNPGSLGYDSSFVNPRRTAIMGVRGGRIEPVFALKKKVTIKGKYYMAAAFNQSKPFVYARANDLAANIVRNIGRASR